jgi:hypothetical protein
MLKNGGSSDDNVKPRWIIRYTVPQEKVTFPWWLSAHHMIRCANVALDESADHCVRLNLIRWQVGQPTNVHCMIRCVRVMLGGLSCEVQLNLATSWRGYWSASYDPVETYWPLVDHQVRLAWLCDKLGQLSLVHLVFFKAKTRNFITSKVDREGHELPKKLQTLERINPNIGLIRVP